MRLELQILYTRTMNKFNYLQITMAMKAIQTSKFWHSFAKSKSNWLLLESTNDGDGFETYEGVGGVDDLNNKYSEKKESIICGFLKVDAEKVGQDPWMILIKWQVEQT